MFTGIVDHCGLLKEIVKTDNDAQLWIESQFEQLQLGESIAVNGICLTVDEIISDGFRCDVSPETLAVTTAGSLQLDAKLNLERSLRAADRIGGHFVLGHVDCVCQLTQSRQLDEYLEYEFAGLNESAENYLIDKGSIAINGVSLTINETSGNTFKVMLIPHTLQRTNLGELKAGDSVNIEYDYLAKIVAKQVSL